MKSLHVYNPYIWIHHTRRSRNIKDDGEQKTYEFH